MMHSPVLRDFNRAPAGETEAAEHQGEQYGLSDDSSLSSIKDVNVLEWPLSVLVKDTGANHDQPAELSNAGAEECNRRDVSEVSIDGYEACRTRNIAAAGELSSDHHGKVTVPLI